MEFNNQDQQRRLEYTARQNALYDYNTMMEERFEDGKKQGIQQQTAELIALWKSKGYSDEYIKELLGR